MQHYSAINYWTPGWIYPRNRLREPYPRHARRCCAALFQAGVALPSTGTPERTFVAGPRGTTFVPTDRGAVFSASPRGVVFDTTTSK